MVKRIYKSHCSSSLIQFLYFPGLLTGIIDNLYASITSYLQILLGAIQKVRSPGGGGGLPKANNPYLCSNFPIKKTNKGGKGGQKLANLGERTF